MLYLYLQLHGIKEYTLYNEIRHYIFWLATKKKLYNKEKLHKKEVHHLPYSE